MTNGTARRQLFRRFTEGGFEKLVDAQPAELADYLEDRAAATGLAAALFLSQAIREVFALFRAHDEGGGVRLGFVHKLDELVRDRLPHIRRSAPALAATLARELRDEIRTIIASYDPQDSYE